MKEPVTCELVIESLAYGGDGVSHLEDGRVVFIPLTAPGDRVRATITHQSKGFARARADEILAPASTRVTPPCPYFGVCGGCQWQHISYEAQLHWKRQAVIDALTRIGKLENAEALVTECTPSPKQLHYRNKMEFAVGRDESGRLTLGLHAMRSADRDTTRGTTREEAIAPIESCLLLPKKYMKAPKALRGALRYIEGNGDLDIARVSLRASNKTSSAEVALWTHPGGFPRAQAAKTLSSALPLTSITRVLYKGEFVERKVSKVEALRGEGSWREELDEYKYTLSSPSFFQVNTRAAELLVKHALNLLDVDGADKVLDLYSGAGTFTLPLAEIAGEVAAVESMGSSVRDLRRNLENNQLDADVTGGDTERELERLAGFDAAIVDPPRSGLGPKVPARLAATGAKRIAYVSCDPSTLARDLPSFKELGYEIVSVTPFDLFPQTYHVETVTLLSKLESHR